MIFHEIVIQQRDSIELIRKKYNHKTSSHSFSALFLWKYSNNLSVYIDDDVFLIKRSDREKSDYFFPCGSDEKKMIIINELLKTEKPFFRYMREEDLNFTKKYFPDKFNFIEARNDWEYIYSKDELINLYGSKYGNLRNKIKKAKKICDWDIVEINSENINLITEITNLWIKKRNTDPNVKDDTSSIKAFKYFNDLKLRGILLYNENKAYAFSVGCEINGDTFDLHMSKSIINDIDNYMKWEFFKLLPDYIKYINREEDLGIKGIRINKTEMNPIFFNKLWSGEVAD